MFDNRFYMIVNVQVAICHGPEYLLIRRGDQVRLLPGILDMPGGKVEFDSPLDGILEATARREIEEEAGLILGPSLMYLTSAGVILPDGEQLINVVYLSPYSGGEPAITRPDEVANVDWYAYDWLCEGDRLQPWTRRYLEQAEVERHHQGW